MKIGVGSLVESESAFKGVGKVVSISSEKKSAIVGFFTSPLSPISNPIEVAGSELIGKSKLFEQTVVYCKVGKSENWRAGFYDGQRPNDEHLIKYNYNDSDVVPLEEVFVPNLLEGSQFCPANFLAGRATTSPMYINDRTSFFNSYLNQRASCSSISSIPSSAVNLEIHQLSVVLQVLNDNVQKYLLGDEVGLGKTIEAGFLVREHILEYTDKACVLILTPPSLVQQWRGEMSQKFHLEDVMDEDLDEEDQKVFIGSFQDILTSKFITKKPTMVVIDEGHQLGSFAWGDDNKGVFSQIASACHNSISTIVLSGTPITGNTKNFLAMLHCLNPDSYQLNDDGISSFNNKIEEREKYSGIYGALVPESDDFTLEGIVEQVESFDFKDDELNFLIANLKPHIDYFSEEKDENQRKLAVKALQDYFGDKYRLFQRFIRNRRGSKNSYIEQIFPGLGDCNTSSWQIGDEFVSLDEQLDDYRNSLIHGDQNFAGITRENYFQWLDALLISPSSLVAKAEAVLASNNTITNEEKLILTTMIEMGHVEQSNKDELLLEEITSWLEKNTDGKIVVFCGDKTVADNVYKFIEQNLPSVERHIDGKLPGFNISPQYNVLICDQSGEDGLNLQGKCRLAIHYSLPRTVMRIEQRIGRLNRYSASSIGVLPVENLVLTPCREGFYGSWAQLLKTDIGVFNQNCSSIQLVLDEKIESYCESIIHQGYTQLDKLSEEIEGESGLVAKERKKVADQEVWNGMQVDLSEIKTFSERLRIVDENADDLSKEMQGWINKSLRFDYRKTEDDNFVFQYQLGRTRLNVDDFVSHCILGMDFDSGLKNPSTKPMSASRDQSAKTGSYPFRYGQPFVDTVYSFSQQTTLGISNAIIREINVALKEPKTFFKLNWICTLESGCHTRVSQRNNDRKLAPKILERWVDELGNEVTKEALVNILNKPYEKSRDLTKGLYRDYNISVGFEQDMWDAVDSFLSKDEWRDLVLSIASDSTEKIKSELNQQYDLSSREEFGVNLSTMRSVTLIGKS
ncbi:protein DpdE [Colwellia psychrerythraea]|uniref:SNF2 family protein n=1 Tax=Colwellia psychrerythraea (strain 34H / ATCC BAA-681) TaxID=167879 RepID=Q47ZX3_COLP3|nr:protein DpdE [Colwellia psychrerythraea]AAZ24667.1 SNF2 family protein [Colwellia psychrerythraea 34H]